MDCGPTCLRMLAKYHGKHYNVNSIKETAGYRKEGVSLLGISEAAKKIGFRSRGVQLTFEQLVESSSLPCILHWNQYHFVVLVEIKKKFLFFRNESIVVADPAKGILTYSRKEFLQYWIATQTIDGELLGIALLSAFIYIFISILNIILGLFAIALFISHHAILSWLHVSLLNLLVGVVALADLFLFEFPQK